MSGAVVVRQARFRVAKARKIPAAPTAAQPLAAAFHDLVRTRHVREGPVVVAVAITDARPDL